MTTTLTIPRHTRPNFRTLLSRVYDDFPDVPHSWATDPLHPLVHANFSNIAPALLDQSARFWLEPHGISYTVSAS